MAYYTHYNQLKQQRFLVSDVLNNFERPNFFNFMDIWWGIIGK